VKCVVQLFFERMIKLCTKREGGRNHRQFPKSQQKINGPCFYAGAQAQRNQPARASDSVVYPPTVVLPPQLQRRRKKGIPRRQMGQKKKEKKSNEQINTVSFPSPLADLRPADHHEPLLRRPLLLLLPPHHHLLRLLPVRLRHKRLSLLLRRLPPAPAGRGHQRLLPEACFHRRMDAPAR
jgi:hypothetical protein